MKTKKEEAKIKILRELARKPNYLYGIARLLKLDRVTISKYVRELEFENKIKIENLDGRTKIVSLK